MGDLRKNNVIDARMRFIEKKARDTAKRVARILDIMTKSLVDTDKKDKDDE